MNSLQQIEGLLFVAGADGISVAELMHVTNFVKPAIMGLLDELVDKYEHDETSGLAVIQTADRYRLVTKASLADVIQRYWTEPRMITLSQAALEVLSIIAYRQPITRVVIDDIRGVQSSAMLQKLMSRDLIAIRGKAAEPGHANLYGTTPYFLDYFGLESLDQLTELMDKDQLKGLYNQNDSALPLLFDEESRA